MTESSITFSISTDVKGNIKISLDDVNKTKVTKNGEPTHEISRCSSLESLGSEFLAAGTRRRPVSPSNTSLDTTSSSIFSQEENSIIRSSTPVSCDEISDGLSDISFTSCVSRISESSILTKSSQETVTSVNCFDISTKKENDSREQYSRRRRDSKTYEEKNKERYGGWVEGDWRTSMKKQNNNQLISPTSKSPSTMNYSSVRNNTTGRVYNAESDQSNQWKSRIPALKTRPSYISPNAKRFIPSERVDNPNKSYASVISTSSNLSVHSKNDSQISSNIQSSYKMTMKTDSEGNMTIQFSNGSSDETWNIDGLHDLIRDLHVHKI